MLCSFLGKGLRVESEQGQGTKFSFWVKQEGLMTTEQRKLFERSYSSQRILTMEEINEKKKSPDRPSLDHEDKAKGSTNYNCPIKEEDKLRHLPNKNSNSQYEIMMAKRQEYLKIRKKSLFRSQDYDAIAEDEDTSEFIGGKALNPIRLFATTHFSSHQITAALTTRANTKDKPLQIMSQNSLGDFAHALIREQEAKKSEKKQIAKRKNAELKKVSSNEPKCFSLKRKQMKAISFFPGEDIEENKALLETFSKGKKPIGLLEDAQKKGATGKYNGTMKYLNNKCDCPIVLMADDNEINKIALSGMLKRLGLCYLESSNGAEALEIIKRENQVKFCCSGIKLVLMDCDMPIMDGITATKEIMKLAAKKEIKSPNVVAVSAFEGTSIEKECIDAGMKEYLTKPVEIEKLFNCIKKYLTTSD